ncbi:hypothetical protein ABBQ32_003355 [Trebouxia sp. C0010 RCD-2024]
MMQVQMSQISKSELVCGSPEAKGSNVRLQPATAPAAALTARVQAQSALSPLSKLDQQKLRESEGLRKAANKTVDALRLGASSVYEAAAALGTFQGKYPVKQLDLLVAFPADEAHLPLIQAGRQWHKGMKTVVTVNNVELVKKYAAEAESVNEVWLSYRDDVPPLRAKHPGDPRAALTPWLAHQAVNGTGYKWILYGDDDTLWFTGGVLNLLKDLDPQMPYVITDNMWWSDVEGAVGSQPNVRAPRCLPCNHSTAGFEDVLDKRPFDAPQGCPCTAESLCKAPELAHFFSAKCDVPRHGSRTYSMHGGAGTIISIGMLQTISLEWMEQCIWSEQAPGGDGLLMACLWKAGYAVTDPGFSFYHPELRMFDPISQEGRQLLYAFTEGLSGGCDSSCQMLLTHVVSSHVRSAVHGIPEAASMIQAMANIYHLYLQQRGSVIEQVHTSLN